MNGNGESLFLKGGDARAVADLCGTPAYVYDQARLEANREAALAFPNAFGLTVRYAMKACPNATILRLFEKGGLHFDASSGHEVRRAMAAGIPAEKISLSAQELPGDLDSLLEAGIRFNACSLAQLERYGELRPGTDVGLRFNPGAGSGGNNRTNVGGPSSSFGIWHEWVPDVHDLLRRYGLRAVRIHTHIGSGSDPEVWLHVADMNFDLVSRFGDVTVLNLGGGYKVGRMPDEASTDLQTIGAPVAERFRGFAERTGRRLHLEIEPGSFLVANAGAVLARVHDIVSTGDSGYGFLKLDTGMTEILRPSLYGAQHPIGILPADGDDQRARRSYIVTGHCCESGDILTPAPGDPELLAPRELTETKIGDFCVIGGAGAYVASMTAKHYNSFPEAPEVLLGKGKKPHLIRRREAPSDLWANEVSPDPGVV